MKVSHSFAVAAVLGGMFFVAPQAEASTTIQHDAGQGDWTFFFDEDQSRFDVVFRNKGAGTVASGLDSPYAGPPGGVGGATGSQADFNFDTLRVNVTSAPTIVVKGIGYLVTPAVGQSYNTASQPDLGIRMRLREDEGAGVIDQFDSFRMTLDWAASMKPAGAEFILFRYNSISEENDINFETAASDLTHDWPVWGHSHWHFGFSEPGDYTLAFGVQGLGGHAGDSPVQTAMLNFSVVPEPTAAVLASAALGMFALRRRRR